MATNLYDLINTVVAGGLLGTLGQGIRMAIGLKKLSDTNATKTEGLKEDLNGTRLLLSLFIGFIAGALFLIMKGTDEIDKQDFIFSVIAAGYSGADFIEGLFKTYISKIDITATANTATTASTTTANTTTANTTSATTGIPAAPVIPLVAVVPVAPLAPVEPAAADTSSQNNFPDTSSFESKERDDEPTTNL